MQLKMAFPNLAIEPHFAHEYWSDFSDDEIRSAVGHIIRTLEQAYTGTGWIAVVIKEAQKQREKRASALSPEQREARDRIFSEVVS